MRHEHQEIGYDDGVGQDEGWTNRHGYWEHSVADEAVILSTFTGVVFFCFVATMVILRQDNDVVIN